jgi:nitrate reductase NapAB chaperone NapD
LLDLLLKKSRIEVDLPHWWLFFWTNLKRKGNMPIGGFVISIDPEAHDEAMESLSGIPHLEIHGSDEQGNIVAVMDTQTTKEMQKIVDQLNTIECVLSVGMTYINVEDETGSDINISGQQVFEEARDKEISA